MSQQHLPLDGSHTSNLQFFRRINLLCLALPGASTPYKRWSKRTVEKVREGFCRNLGESA